MDLPFFQQQMDRLKTQWPTAYSAERQKIFFNAFRDVSNFDFRDAISYCLANSRSAPLLPEITEAIAKSRAAYFEQKRLEEAGTMGALLHAADNNTTADPEFVDRCLKLLDDLYNKKITREQFYQGCDLIDQASKLYKNKERPNPTINTKKPYKDDDDDDKKPF